MAIRFKELKNQKTMTSEKQKSVKRILDVIEEEHLPVNPKLLSAIKKISNLN